VTKEKELKDLLACFKKDRHIVVSQVKQVVLPPIDNSTKVTPNVRTSSTLVTYEDVSSMFVEYDKHLRIKYKE
jgi:hypothetical protein